MVTAFSAAAWSSNNKAGDEGVAAKGAKFDISDLSFFLSVGFSQTTLESDKQTSLLALQIARIRSLNFLEYHRDSPQRPLVLFLLAAAILRPSVAPLQSISAKKSVGVSAQNEGKVERGMWCPRADKGWADRPPSNNNQKLCTVRVKSASSSQQISS